MNSAEKFLSKTLQKRRQMADKELALYPDSLPVVLVKAREYIEYIKRLQAKKEAGPNDPPLQLKLFSTKKDSKMLQMIEKIRQHFLMVDKTMGVFIYTLKEKNLVSMNTTVQEMYKNNKSQDGWLYLLCDTQQVF